ncbi:MAG: acyloxyacyl hydrolase, partial [Bacteroidia bacterium]
MSNRLAIFLFMLLQSIILYAQEFSPHQIRVKAEHGFVMRHTPKLDYIIRNHTQGLELEWSKQTYGEKPWHQGYNYPTWGLLYSLRNLGNKELLGNGHALIFNTRFPLIRNDHWISTFAVGTGPAIIEKRFHNRENYKNIAIGTHLNLAIRFEASMAYKIKNAGALGAALAFNHYSNGAFTSPNLGLNIPSLGLTYTYFFGEMKEAVSDTEPAFIRSFEKTIVLVAGVKEIAPPGGNKFLVLGSAFTLSRKLSYKSRLGAGLDLIHDPSAGERLERDSLSYTTLDNIRTGLFISHEWMISDFSLITQAGTYLYAKKNTEGNFYQRIGFRYSWNEKYFINVALKTHFANADYGEWGIGYR